MSHWIKGKIALGCSIDILQKALIRIKKDWKSHIEVDPDGNLKIDGSQDNFHVVMRGVGTAGYGSPDVGFKKVGKEWEMSSYDFYDVPNLKGKVTQEVTLMRYEELVRLQEVGEIIETGNSDGGKKKRIVLRAPVDEKYLYEA